MTTTPTMKARPRLLPLPLPRPPLRIIVIIIIVIILLPSTTTASTKCTTNTTSATHTSSTRKGRTFAFCVVSRGPGRSVHIYIYTCVQYVQYVYIVTVCNIFMYLHSAHLHFQGILEAYLKHAIHPIISVITWSFDVGRLSWLQFSMIFYQIGRGQIKCFKKIWHGKILDEDLTRKTDRSIYRQTDKTNRQNRKFDTNKSVRRHRYMCQKRDPTLPPRLAETALKYPEFPRLHHSDFRTI